MLSILYIRRKTMLEKRDEKFCKYLCQNIADLRGAELTISTILKEYEYDEAEILYTFGCNLYDVQSNLKDSREVLTKLRAEKLTDGMQEKSSLYLEKMLATDAVLNESFDTSYEDKEPVRDLDLIECYKNIRSSIKSISSYIDCYEELEAIKCYSSTRISIYELTAISNDLKGYINAGKDFEIVDDNSENGYTVYLNENVDENSMN